MKVSIVIIGLDVSFYLPICISSIKVALENASDIIEEHEIIYVDSGSKDESKSVASDNGVDNVISVTKGEPSAGLGRTLGIRHSKFENILFLDADFEVDEYFFSLVHPHYVIYNACVPERAEYLWDDFSSQPLLLDERYYKFNGVEPLKRFGGFLMINKKIFGHALYNPYFKSEEEGAFYINFYEKHKVYSVPHVGYKHLNVNSRSSILRNYLKPKFRCDYIASIFLSIKNKTITNCFQVQRDQFLAFFLWVFIFLVSLIDFESLIITPILFLFFLSMTYRKKSFCITSFFLPIKLGCVLLYYFRKRDIYYTFNNIRYIIKGNFLNYKISELK